MHLYLQAVQRAPRWPVEENNFKDNKMKIDNNCTQCGGSSALAGNKMRVDFVYADLAMTDGEELLDKQIIEKIKDAFPVAGTEPGAHIFEWAEIPELTRLTDYANKEQNYQISAYNDGCWALSSTSLLGRQDLTKHLDCFVKACLSEYGGNCKLKKAGLIFSIAISSQIEDTVNDLLGKEGSGSPWELISGMPYRNWTLLEQSDRDGFTEKVSLAERLDPHGLSLDFSVYWKQPGRLDMAMAQFDILHNRLAGLFDAIATSRIKSEISLG